ncbi:MAG: ABC transporter permease [Chloroflexi bacterium]|nr:ABC transporter permease [Chloroflexota bacterium]
MPKVARITGSLARRQPTAVFGFFVLLLVVFAALFAPWVSPYSPLAQLPGEALAPPSGAHVFGTDALGRDILSRTIWGARTSMYIALLALALAGGVGTVVGMLSGYLEGAFDVMVQRVVDILMGFPTLILALAMVAFLKPSATNVAVALSIVFAPRIARFVRGSMLSLKQNEYVNAARAVGCTDVRIMARHLLPNAIPYVAVYTSLFFGNAVLAEASLGFLGVGVPPPTPSWGRELSGAASQYLTRAPWMTVFPGFTIAMMVLAANLIGDGLRDVLDPKLRRR